MWVFLRNCGSVPVFGKDSDLGCFPASGSRSLVFLFAWRPYRLKYIHLQFYPIIVNLVFLVQWRELKTKPWGQYSDRRHSNYQDKRRKTKLREVHDLYSSKHILIWWNQNLKLRYYLLGPKVVGRMILKRTLRTCDKDEDQWQTTVNTVMNVPISLTVRLQSVFAVHSKQLDTSSIMFCVRYLRLDLCSFEFLITNIKYVSFYCNLAKRF